jgi:outer membrane protein insertion porin family/translocation and assembly module TamA
VIRDVAILGNRAIPDKDIREKIATAESTYVLGGLLGTWDPLTLDYERFDRFVLERDLSRIERYYRSRGFYEAHVRASRVIRLPDGKVRVEIAVDEGQPVTLRKVDLAWKDWRMPEAAAVTKPVTDAKNELKLGERFEEDAYEANKKAIAQAMAERGFPYANVNGQVKVDLLSHKADVTYTVELGPRATFGDIRIVGLGELPEKPIRASLGFEKGDPFSSATLASAELALAELGVFGAIDVKPELGKEGERRTVVPVTITVQPTALRGVKLGLGAEVGSRVEGHLTASWEDRNFLGGLRHFTVEARPGVVLSQSSINSLLWPPKPLPELRSRFELRQPNVIEARTSAILRGSLNIYLPTWSPETVQAARTKGIDLNVGYREYTTDLGLERRFVNYQHYLGEFLHLQLEDPFSYTQDKPPPGYERLFIAYLETIAQLDFRRGENGQIDRVNPRRGFYLAVDTQIAGFFLPGLTDANDVRLRPEFRAYLPIAKPVTFAFRFVSGFLFAKSYGSTLNSETPSARDLQIMQFRGFFSGGPSSNRGYIYNGVGPRGPLTFFSPSLDPTKEITGPTGGRTLWESSAELRFAIGESFGVNLFVDGSDVTRGEGDLRLSHPHLSTGLGLRYATPVGPVRADVGYRIPCLQVIGDCGPLPTSEGNTQLILGLPIAVSLAIGEAF